MSESSPSNLAWIEVDEPVTQGDRARLTGRLVGPNGRTREVFFEIDLPDARPLRKRLRPFLLAFLPVAMRQGWDLASRETLDRTTEENLQQWQASFAAWRPWSLGTVDWDFAVAEEPPFGPRLGGMVAFSGGVDSSLTVQRRVATGELASGVLVQGLDIPLGDEAAFATARAGAAASLGAMGLRCHSIRTNVRSLGRKPFLHWEQETFGIWLAAAMSCMEPWHDRAFIASSYPYRHLALACGSNPVTDRFLGSGATPYVHDGADLSRVEKAAALAAEPRLADRLRVCFDREGQGGNCGRCRKCMLTQLCLWLGGDSAPKAFPRPCRLEDIRTIQLPPSIRRYYLPPLVCLARERGREDILRVLEGLGGNVPLRQRVMPALWALARRVQR
jgi:hypothetical protein